MADVNETCIYKSITLQAGEVFSLPPNAELLYVSDTDNVISSCDDELPNVQTQCYVFRTPMSGTDVDESQEFFLTSFKFDNLVININPGYGSGLGTCVTSSDGVEGPQEFIERLANNIWGQLPNIPNAGIILGVKTRYQNANTQPSGDIVEITINIPKIFTTVLMTINDADNQGVFMDIIPREEGCTDSTVGNIFGLGNV